MQERIQDIDELRRIADRGPRSLRDESNREARYKLVHAPHVSGLNMLVEQISSHDLPTPWFDPLDGGVTAHMLLLLQSPGAHADSTRGSGFISSDNDDMSAERVWRTIRASEVDRSNIVIWNIVPWFIGSRKPLAQDRQRGGSFLLRVLELLPELSRVVLMGGEAKAAWRQLEKTTPTMKSYSVTKSRHPRARLSPKKIESSIVNAMVEERSSIQRDAY